MSGVLETSPPYSGYNLHRAHLEGAYLRSAHLESTGLANAHLKEADLQEVHFEGAYLAHADLRKADLGEAHLSRANLQGADLREVVDLTQEKLERANGDQTTVLPDDLDHWTPAWWSSLPKDSRPLDPQEYSIKVCKIPLRFSGGDNWYTNLSLPNSFNLTAAGISHTGSILSVDHIRWVCDRQKPSEEYAIEKAPKDMVAWFIDRPYLTIENLDNVEIGGAPGTRFDAVVYPVPDECILGFRRPFVPLFPASPREGPFGLMEGNKNRIIILNVQNETVTIIIESPLDEFEGFLVRAEEILGTVKWDL